MRVLLSAAFLLLSYTLALAGDFNKEYPDDPVAVIRTNLGDIHVELFAREAPRTVENFIGLAEGKKKFVDPKTGQEVKRPYYDNLIFHRVIKNFMIQGGCPLGTGQGGPGYRFKDEINATALGLHEMKAIRNGTPHRWLLVRSQQDFQRTVVHPLLRAMGIRSQKHLEERKEAVKKRLDGLTLKGVYENLGYEFSDTLKSHPLKKGVIAMANSGPNTNGSQFFINLADTPWLTGKHTVFGKVVKGMDVVEKMGGVKVGAGSKPVKDVKILRIRLLRE